MGTPHDWCTKLDEREGCGKTKIKPERKRNPIKGSKISMKCGLLLGMVEL